MKKIIQLCIAFSFFMAAGQQFSNGGFESVSCANDCSSANSQMSCVDDWFENNVTAIDPLQKSFCNPNFVCTGDYSIMLSQTSGAPSSDIKTVNPYAGMNLNGMPQVVNLNVKVIDAWSTSATGIHIRGTNTGPGSISVDQVNLGFNEPAQNDVCENMSIIVDPSVNTFSHLIFATSVLSGSHLGGHSSIIDDVATCGDLFEVTDNCGKITIELNDTCETGLVIDDWFAEVFNSGGTSVGDDFNSTGDPLTIEVTQAGDYNINLLVIFSLNGQFQFLDLNIPYTVDSLVADDVEITANGTDITSSLEYTIPCGESCVTINATNITGAVYNSSDPVFTDLQGLFCVPPGSNITQFTADITGFDSCGDPYSESVQVFVEQDCCIDEPYVEPYWNHPNCPEVVCTAEQWPIQVLSSDGTPISSAGGVIISWFNPDTGETLNQDWIYTEAHETWIVTITYPNGCEYTAEYREDCCEGEIEIEALLCPEVPEIVDLQNYLEASRETYTHEDYATMENTLDRMLDEAMGRGGRDCDPCDEEWVLIQLVDENGDPIDPNCTVVWSDGGSGTMRGIPTDFLITATVTKIVDGYECVYTDEFIYECEDCSEVTAPTNLAVAGTTLTWDPVPGAVGYIVSSPPGNVPQIDCRCELGVSLAPVNTTTNSHPLPSSLHDKCFIWWVQAVCADGTISEHSTQACFTPVRSASRDFESALVAPNPNKGNMNFVVETTYKTDVIIEIYDFYGRRIQSFNEHTNAHEVKSIEWNATMRLSKGVYFVTFKTANETINRKVVVE